MAGATGPGGDGSYVLDEVATGAFVERAQVWRGCSLIGSACAPIEEHVRANAQGGQSYQLAASSIHRLNPFDLSTQPATGRSALNALGAATGITADIASHEGPLPNLPYFASFASPADRVACT
jgi:hypothetical protein